MNTDSIPLFAFVSILLIILAGLGWFFRDTFKNLQKTAADHSKSYMLSYVKCASLMMISAGTTFKEVFGPVTSEMASKFTWYDWTIKFLAPILAALAVMSAFLDRSFQKAQDEQCQNNNSTAQ